MNGTYSFFHPFFVIISYFSTQYLGWMTPLKPSDLNYTVFYENPFHHISSLAGVKFLKQDKNEIFERPGAN